MQTVKTNMGEIPVNDYRDIKAQEKGFDDFRDMIARGYHLKAPLTKGNFLYKVCIDQFTDGFKGAGSAVLTEDFDTLDKARIAAKEYALSKNSIITINEYDLSERNTIAFESEQDTGTTVYRYIKGITDVLEKEFDKCCEDEGFEGTMSYLIDIIKEGTPELAYLQAPINLLTDAEINVLLEAYGDLEYRKCVNGELVDADEE